MFTRIVKPLSCSAAMFVTFFGISAIADVGEPDPAPKARPAAAVAERAEQPMAPAFIESDASTLLVVPVRYTIVQFAFDMAKLRPMALVAYEDNPTNKTPHIYVWNASVYDWMRMDLSEFKSASFMKTPPKNLLLVGGDIGGPLSLSEAATWATDKRVFPTFNIVSIVNSLNELFDFSVEEWKLLARKYDLKLKDLNEDRRRYGKWGPTNRMPEEAMPLPKAKSDEADKEVAPLPQASGPVSEILEPIPVAAPVVQPPVTAPIAAPVATPVPAPIAQPPVVAPAAPPPAAPEDK